MLPPPARDPQWINQPHQLHTLADDLLRFPRLAVDTESNSLYAYREQVCLVQFSTPEADFLVDPLALPVLAPLGKVFSNPDCESIFHAAEYDILCLKRDYGFEFSRIFDTMLAARILGKTEIGLANLLHAEFGLTLDKRNQRADWGKRPLPRGMLTYARLDTYYLAALRDRLAAQLAERELLDLAEEDFRRMAALRPLPPPAPQTAWDLADPRRTNPAEAAILQVLLEFRERLAHAADVPPFKILSNSVLIELAQRKPVDFEGMSDIRGLTPGLIQRYGPDLLHAIQRGQRSAPFPAPRHQRPPQAVLKRLESLRNWRKSTAQAQGVESDVVLPRDLLYQLAEQHPRSSGELQAIFTHLPWRLARYGDQILEVLNKGHG